MISVIHEHLFIWFLTWEKFTFVPNLRNWLIFFNRKQLPVCVVALYWMGLWRHYLIPAPHQCTTPSTRGVVAQLRSPRCECRCGNKKFHVIVVVLVVQWLCVGFTPDSPGVELFLDVFRLSNVFPVNMFSLSWVVLKPFSTSPFRRSPAKFFES